MTLFVKGSGQWLCAVWVFIAAAAWAEGYPNDPYLSSSGTWGQGFDDQWALKSLRVYTDAAATANPQATSRNVPVIVAVIDTGMDYLHADFSAARLWRNPAEMRNSRDDDNNGYVDDLIGWNFVDNNNNPWDQSGHGTHISGLIAACTDNETGISAVNADARIMALKVADFTGQARSSAVAAAIYYAVDNGARVINLSLGSELITDLERGAAEYAVANDVLIVVSAGNKGLSANHLGYATLPGVLVVGASGIDGERAGFSNFGSQLDVLAPGVDLLSLRANDTDFIALSDPPDYPPGEAIVGEEGDYYRASGTSFSAAMASGVASRLMALRPELTAAEVKRIMVQSAVDVAADGVDQISGYGRVDFVRAMGADPARYVNARLSGVELDLADQMIWLSFQGTAAADQFSIEEVSVRAAPGSITAADPEVASGPNKNKSKKKRKKKSGDQKAPSPFDWQPVIPALSGPVNEGVLGKVGLDSLIAMTGGSTSWELRLIVTSESGTSRESRMAIALPVPGPARISADNQPSAGGAGDE